MTYDAIILGGGAAGLFCAGIAGQRGLKVLVIDHAKKPAEKVRISGGGRCNFTNKYSTHKNFISQNPHFAKSALARYTPQDFIDLVEAHKISHVEKSTHENTKGQLFCEGSSQQIIDLLMSECEKGNVQVSLNTRIEQVDKTGEGFRVQTQNLSLEAKQLVVATGGKSIPKMGATGFGYELAKQFDLPLVPTKAGLVPFVFREDDKGFTSELTGVSVDAKVTANKTSFQEGLLFTHRGASGPSILQASTYWNEGDAVTLDLLPATDFETEFKAARDTVGSQFAAFFVAKYLPNRLASELCKKLGLNKKLAEISKKDQNRLIEHIKRWQLHPQSTEGYRTAEVTVGGVDTSALSSQTMEAKQVPGLYFIGEVVDVTGHLGGHNFQWAWASGNACALALNNNLS